MSTFDRRRSRAEAEPFVMKALSLMGDGQPVDLFAPVTRPVPLIAGSWRRMSDSVGDVDVILVTEDETLAGWSYEGMHVTRKSVSGWIEMGDGRMMVDGFWCPPESIGPFGVFLTGPAQLNVWLRQRANGRGMMVSQYGLFERIERDGKAERGRRIDEGPYDRDVDTAEMQFLAALGLPWLPPSERDDWAHAWAKGGRYD